jgi:hypothetical protein
LTRRLFQMKAAVEQSLGAEFELHVKATQARPLLSLVPQGFELVDFR